MASVLAIVSKKVFETDVADRKVGAVYETDLYRSKHKALAPLSDGGDLFLVTVRPPKEALWLVAVLDQSKLTEDGWKNETNVVPITDVSHLRSELKFATGKGMSQKKGALGMSLQTPRELNEADVTLLRGALGKSKNADKPKKVTNKKTRRAAEPAPRAPSLDVGVIRWTDGARKYLRPRSVAELPKAKSARALFTAWKRDWYNRKEIVAGDRALDLLPTFEAALARRGLELVADPPIRFRIAADRTAADLADEPLQLDDSGSVRVAHPVRWSEEQRARWRELFADYELLSPFGQLQRESLAVGEADTDKPELSRKEPSDRDALLGRLRRLGFVGSSFSYLARPLPGEVFGYLRILPKQAVVLGIRHLDRPVSFGELDAVARTELLRIADEL